MIVSINKKYHNNHNFIIICCVQIFCFLAMIRNFNIIYTMNIQTQQSLENYLELFFQYLAESKNASPKTIENYSLWLWRFVGFVGELTPNQLIAFHILNFRLHLKKMWLWVKTINYHIVSLRSFLKFLLRNDIDTLAPEKCDLAKIDAREVSYLTEKELEDLLSAPYRFEPKEIPQLRDAALLSFLFSTWLRVSELIALTKERIRTDSKQLTVMGKWRKIRSTFITQDASEKLEEYWSVRTDDSEFVFVSHAKNLLPWWLSRNSVENIVKKYTLLCGINKKITPHTIRHSFATQLLKKWADIRSVQALLGHASITTTQIYTHVDDKHLAQVHKMLEG